MVYRFAKPAALHRSNALRTASENKFAASTRPNMNTKEAASDHHTGGAPSRNAEIADLQQRAHGLSLRQTRRAAQVERIAHRVGK